MYHLPNMLLKKKIGQGEQRMNECGPVLTLCDPVDCSPPASSVHGILQPEYWSGLPFPSPGDLPNPVIKRRSPELQAYSLSSEPPEKPSISLNTPKIVFFFSGFKSSF